MAKKKNTKVDLNDVANEDFSFEDAMGQIESIVLDLESGKLKLGDSLKQYEAAIGKLKRCHEYLEFAEAQVSVLSGVDADGNPITAPLGGEDGDSDQDLSAKQASRGARRSATKRTTKTAKPAASADDADSDDDDGLVGLF